MSMYAFREETGPMSREEAERLAERLAVSHGDQLWEACFAPEPGIMLTVLEGEPPADEPDHGGRPFRVLPITAEEYGPPEMEPAAGDVEHLPLVLVRRHLDPLTQREFKVIALQALMCAYEYTDLRWLRSYWDREKNELHCLFRTKEHELVREHARRSRIPCDEIYDAVPLKTP